MSRLTSLTATLLRDWMRDREAVFFAVAFPLILLVIFSVVFAGGTGEFEVAVQNNDLDADGEPTELSETLVNAIEEADPLSVERLDADRDLADVENVEEATGHQRVIVIPDGFEERVRSESVRVRAAVIRDTVDRAGEDITAGQREQIEAALGTAPTETDGPVQITILTAPDDDAAGAVRSILESLVATFSDRSIGVEEPTVTVTPEQRGQAGLGAADYFLPAFIVAMILINGLMTVPAAVSAIRHDGTLKRLAVTPLRKREWILANVIQQSILAVAIAGLMIAVAWLAFDVTVAPGVLAVALIVVGAVAFTALGMILGSLVKSPGTANSLGGGIALPLMFVSGIFWELDLMPESVQAVAEFSPVTHYHRSLRRLMILESTDGVAVTFLVLAGLAVVFLAGAVRLTDWHEFD